MNFAEQIYASMNELAKSGAAGQPISDKVAGRRIIFDGEMPMPPRQRAMGEAPPDDPAPVSASRHPATVPVVQSRKAAAASKPAPVPASQHPAVVQPRRAVAANKPAPQPRGAILVSKQKPAAVPLRKAISGYPESSRVFVFRKAAEAGSALVKAAQSPTPRRFSRLLAEMDHARFLHGAIA